MCAADARSRRSQGPTVCSVHQTIHRWFGGSLNPSPYLHDIIAPRISAFFSCVLFSVFFFLSLSCLSFLCVESLSVLVALPNVKVGNHIAFFLPSPLPSPHGLRVLTPNNMRVPARQLFPKQTEDGPRARWQLPLRLRSRLQRRECVASAMFLFSSHRACACVRAIPRLAVCLPLFLLFCCPSTGLGFLGQDGISTWTRGPLGARPSHATPIRLSACLDGWLGL